MERIAHIKYTQADSNMLGLLIALILSDCESKAGRQTLKGYYHVFLGLQQQFRSSSQQQVINLTISHGLDDPSCDSSTDV